MALDPMEPEALLRLQSATSALIEIENLLLGNCPLNIMLSAAHKEMVICQVAFSHAHSDARHRREMVAYLSSGSTASMSRLAIGAVDTGDQLRIFSSLRSFGARSNRLIEDCESCIFKTVSHNRLAIVLVTSTSLFVRNVLPVRTGLKGNILPCTAVRWLLMLACEQLRGFALLALAVVKRRWIWKC